VFGWGSGLIRTPCSTRAERGRCVSRAAAEATRSEAKGKRRRRAVNPVSFQAAGRFPRPAARPCAGFFRVWLGERIDSNPVFDLSAAQAMEALRLARSARSEAGVPSRVKSMRRRRSRRSNP